jgi:hypothetical protein
LNNQQETTVHFFFLAPLAFIAGLVVLIVLELVLQLACWGWCPDGGSKQVEARAASEGAEPAQLILYN